MGGGCLLPTDRQTRHTSQWVGMMRPQGKGGARHAAGGPKFEEASSWLLVSAYNWKGRMLLENTLETNHSGWAPP